MLRIGLLRPPSDIGPFLAESNILLKEVGDKSVLIMNIVSIVVLDPAASVNVKPILIYSATTKISTGTKIAASRNCA